MADPADTLVLPGRRGRPRCPGVGPVARLPGARVMGWQETGFLRALETL